MITNKTFFYSCSIETPWFCKNRLRHGTISITDEYALCNQHETIRALHKEVADNLGKDQVEVVLTSIVLLGQLEE